MRKRTVSVRCGPACVATYQSAIAMRSWMHSFIRAGDAERAPVRDLHPVVGEAERRARQHGADHRRASRCRTGRGSGTAPRRATMISRPPIVGVPALAAWPTGPSSRICWPNSRSLRNSMNFGPRNMQMNRRAHPRDEDRAEHACLGEHPLQADGTRPLDQHTVARLGDLLEQRARLLGRWPTGTSSRRRSPRRTRAPPRRLSPAHPRRARPRARRSRGESAGSSGPARPLSRGPPRGAPPASRQGDRVRLASTSGWRCSSR